MGRGHGNRARRVPAPGRRSAVGVAVLGAPACARSGYGTRPQPADCCRARVLHSGRSGFDSRRGVLRSGSGRRRSAAALVRHAPAVARPAPGRVPPRGWPRSVRGRDRTRSPADRRPRGDAAQVRDQSRRSHPRRSRDLHVEAGRGTGGSGCHLHQSLLSAQTGQSLFFDPGREDGLSDVAASYIAGQLATLADFTCIWDPTPNSYKRLLPFVGGTVSWAFANRAAALRVGGNDAESFRIEHRAPGGETNVYLAMAAAIAGGLHGIEAGLEAPPPSTGAFYRGSGRRDDPDLARGGDRALRGQRDRARVPR